jgi:hypothetical protein
VSRLYALVAVTALLAASVGLVRLARPRSALESPLLVFLFSSALLTVSGNVLSSLRLYGSLPGWAAATTGSLRLTASIARWGPWPSGPLFPGLGELGAPLWGRIRALPAWKKCALGALASGFCLTATLNLGLVLFTAPHNWDSMTYHLARVAYFLQHGHHEHFEANYWAQVVHPRSASSILSFIFLVSLRNENATQLAQYWAYLTSAIAAYGIARRLGYARSSSAFGALVFALLTEVLMEATTTQNDLLLTAHLAIGLYFLAAFRDGRSERHLVIAAVAVAMALATKSSSLLALPSVAVVAAASVFGGKPHSTGAARSALVLAVAGAASVLLLALPSGYWQNLRRYGHPIGPVEVRAAHSVETVSFAQAVGSGLKNTFRYGFDFLSLDGFPPFPVVRSANALVRAAPRAVVQGLGLQLEGSDGARGAFSLSKPAYSHEDLSSWGLLGWSLVWPSVVYHLCSRPGRRAGASWAAAAILFLLVQSFSGPYDPWRGRYFIALAALAAPLTAATLERASGRFLRLALVAVAVAGSFSAVSAVLLRKHSPLIAAQSLTGRSFSVFELDRLRQLAHNRPGMVSIFEKLERLTPREAVVAAALPEDSFEYPLFGEGLTRRVVPVRSAVEAERSNATVLVFTSAVVAPRETDTPLGQGWFVRPLCSLERAESLRRGETIAAPRCRPPQRR